MHFQVSTLETRLLSSNLNDHTVQALSLHKVHNLTSTLAPAIIITAPEDV